MAFLNPSVSNFKSYFVRDFPYSNDSVSTTEVNDTDLTNAISDAAYFINPGFFQDQVSFNIGIYNLSAHFLVESLRSSSQGISGQYSWLESSKGAGGVSQGLSIPQRILDNPQYAWLTKTNYGMKYLMLIWPYLMGQMFTVSSDANP